MKGLCRDHQRETLTVTKRSAPKRVSVVLGGEGRGTLSFGGPALGLHPQALAVETPRVGATRGTGTMTRDQDGHLRGSGLGGGVFLFLGGEP